MARVIFVSSFQLVAQKISGKVYEDDFFKNAQFQKVIFSPGIAVILYSSSASL